MGHLTGDHVDLIRMGGGNDHVGVACARALQNVRIGGEARDPLHVERFGRAAHQFDIVVDDRDVVLFTRQMPRDLPADLARAADDDFHGRSRMRLPLLIGGARGAVNGAPNAVHRLHPPAQSPYLTRPSGEPGHGDIRPSRPAGDTLRGEITEYLETEAPAALATRSRRAAKGHVLSGNLSLRPQDEGQGL